MPFLTQGKTNWKLLIIVIILAIIVGGSALWYSKRPEKPYQPVEVKKPETANWKTYQWDNLEFKYPSNWTVEKTYYQTPAQEANGEPPVNIGLAIFPGTKSTGNDFIAIGGHQVSCDPSENHTKCQFVSSISDFIYTDSNNPDILKAFDQIVPTLKLVENETANWKTYRNEEYGFEIKYPEDWISEVKQPSYLCEAGPGYDCLASIQFSHPKTLESIDLIIITNPNEYSAAEWIEKYTPEILNDPKTILYKDIKIGENKWAKLVTTINTGNNRNVALSISKNKKLYAFGIFIKEGREEIENILKQMLSTFRFL